MKHLLYIATLCLLSCGGGGGNETQDSTSTAQPSVTNAVQMETFADSVSETYNGWKAQFTLDCQLPQGEDSLSLAVRTWFNQILAANFASEPSPQLSTSALFAHYAQVFRQHNSVALIQAQVESWKQQARQEHPELTEELVGNDSVPTWEHRYWLSQVYEDEDIISFEGGSYCYGVENATSTALCHVASFLKQSGRQLDFSLFTSEEELLPLIKEALIKKYGEDQVDIYNLGIPMPQGMILMRDGVKFEYGDYVVIAPHYFEEHHVFPSCFLTYAQLQPVLSAQAPSPLQLPQGGGNGKVTFAN